MELVAYKNDTKMKASYTGEILKQIIKCAVENENSKNHEKMFKKYNLKLLYDFFERKPG